MKHFAFLTIAAIAIAGCEMTDASMTEMSADATAAVSRDAVMSATTVAEITALGGRELTAAEFTAELVDKPLIGDNWTWTISSDGTHNSAANDGSWEDEGTWTLQGNTYCRDVGDPGVRCSTVYEAGGVYKFTEENDTLSGWSATLG